MKIESHMELVGQTLTGIHCTDTSIRSAVFEECRFVGCHFNNTTFEYGVFDDCEFVACDLSLVTFVQTRLTRLAFERSKCMGINWTTAVLESGRFGLGQPLIFKDCSLNYGIFLGLTLPSIKIYGCSALEADFREADLSQADFKETDLTRALFQHTKLNGCDFSSARNYQIDPRVNELKGAKFSFPEVQGLLEPLEITLVDSL